MPVKHRRTRRNAPEAATARLLDESRQLRLQLDQIAPEPARADDSEALPAVVAVADRVQEYLEPHRAAFPDSPFHRPAPTAGGAR